MELPQLNISPTVIRSEPSGGIIAVSQNDNRSQVRRLEGNEWKVVIDLISASERVHVARELFREPKKDGAGFEGVVPSIPAIAMDNGATRVAWTTSRGAILSLPTASPEAAPTVVSSPGHGAPDEIAISGDPQTGALVSVGEKGAPVFRTGKEMKSRLNPSEA